MGEREGAAEPLPRRRIARRGAVAWHLPPRRACRSIRRGGEREEWEGETEVRGRRGRAEEEEDNHRRRRARLAPVTPARIGTEKGETDGEREEGRICKEKLEPSIYLFHRIRMTRCRS